MSFDPSSLLQTISIEMMALRDARVCNLVAGLLTPPTVSMRPWDYGTPNTLLPCWTVLIDPASSTDIAYCEQGFGPQCPWGLLHHDPTCSMGMDSGWFPKFTDALFDSAVPTRVAIWCVAKNAFTSGRTILTDQMSFDAAWELVESLRKADPEARYDCIDLGVR